MADRPPIPPAALAALASTLPTNAADERRIDRLMAKRAAKLGTRRMVAADHAFAAVVRGPADSPANSQRPREQRRKAPGRQGSDERETKHGPDRETPARPAGVIPAVVRGREGR